MYEAGEARFSRSRRMWRCIQMGLPPSVQFTMTRPRQTHGSSRLPERPKASRHTHRLRESGTDLLLLSPLFFPRLHRGDLVQKISQCREGWRPWPSCKAPPGIGLHQSRLSFASFQLSGLFVGSDQSRRSMVSSSGSYPWSRYIHKGSRNSSAFLSHHDSRHPRGFFPRMYAYACSSTAS